MAMLRDSVWTMHRAEIAPLEVPLIFQSFFQMILAVCLPLVAIAIMLGISTSLGQVGVTFSSESLAMDWSKLSPAKGAKKALLDPVRDSLAHDVSTHGRICRRCHLVGQRES